MEGGHARRILNGHTGPIEALVFEDQGVLLVSASRDGTIRIWDYRSGRCCQIIQAHAFPILALAISGDGERLASGDSDGTIKLWQVHPPRAKMTLKGLEGRIRGVAFNPEASVLLSAAEDGRFRAWCPATGRSIAVLEGHRGSVSAWCSSPDRKRIATAGSDGLLRLWGADEIRCLQTLALPCRAVHSICLGSSLIASADSAGHLQLSMLEDSQHQPLLTDQVPAPRGAASLGIAILPRGGLLVVGGPDRAVRGWTIPSSSVSSD